VIGVQGHMEVGVHDVGTKLVE